jgi:hypothetical protein
MKRVCVVLLVLMLLPVVVANPTTYTDAYLNNTWLTIDNTKIAQPANTVAFTIKNGVNNVSFGNASGANYILGNLGIGTTTPGALLHLNAGAGNYPNIYFTGNNNARTGYITLEGGTGYFYYNPGANGGHHFRNSSSGTMLMLLANGHVGIGTTAPNQKLDVNGSINISNATAKIYTPELCLAGNCQTAWPSGGGGGWTDGGAIVYTTTTADNVGIGTTTPAAKLTIGNNVGSTYLNTYPEYQTIIYDGGVAALSYGWGINANTMVFNSGAGAYRFDRGGAATTLTMDTAGNVRIGSGTPTQATLAGELYVTGDIEADGTIYGPGVDVAERFTTSDTFLPGELAVLDLHGGVRKSSEPYSTIVAGVVTTKPALVLGSDNEGVALALKGQVPVRVNDENGPVKAGDYLVTSSTPGVAMGCRLSDLASAGTMQELRSLMIANERCRNAVFGKAMTDVEDGRVIGLV